MTTYYLMPTKYAPKSELVFDKIKKVESQYSKVGQLAKDYEKQLNNGDVWDPLLVINGRPMFCVVAAPYSEVRDYRNFDEWECEQ